MKKAGVLSILFVVLLLAVGVAADAQQAGKIFRIGYLDAGTVAGSAGLLDTFWQEMRKLGWIEGKNITIEYGFGEEKRERLPDLAAELVRLKVDLIVATSAPSVLAAKEATTFIPIVMANSADPVGEGLVTSLARPGGNVTGLSGLAVELNTKRLEILKDVIPKLSRVGLLRPPPGATIAIDLQLKDLRAAASALKFKLEEIETQSGRKSLESAFQTQPR